MAPHYDGPFERLNADEGAVGGEDPWGWVQRVYHHDNHSPDSNPYTDVVHVRYDDWFCCNNAFLSLFARPLPPSPSARCHDDDAFL